MTIAAPIAQLRPTLSEELLALYEEIHARVGEEDLAHIRHIAAYSRAIKARSEVLLQKGGKPGAWKRGVMLHALHTLLEFSELGHNIMHGSYDHLPNAGLFHSERWRWNFVIDPREWRVMHHQNHHPFTNIVGKDHDLGYSFLRAKPGQPWYGHHAVQPAILATIAMLFPSYAFPAYTATSAARTEGRKVLSRDTFRETLKLMGRHARKNFIEEPLQAGPRFFETLLGNYAATVLGYDLTIAILFLEHHAPNVLVFPDPGPDESQDSYFRRQILGTSNFTPYAALDAYGQTLLEEEVDFPDRPGFEVFYGGLDTHLEHHLFPDLPCNRQREIAPRVREICERHGMPYNTVPLEEVVPDLLKNIAKLAVPTGEAEPEGLRALLRQPRQLVHRLRHGLRYRTPSPTTYLKAPRFFDVSVKVLEATPQADGQALSLRLELPKGWDEVQWDAGAFVSLRVPVGEEVLVRQYSLTTDSAEATTLDITVKRVQGGRASNWLNDNLRAGQRVTLVGPPQSDGSFIMKAVPEQALFLAGGVGITPIISMIRKFRREAPQARTTLLYFNRDERSIIFEQELRELATASGLDLHFICDKAPAARPNLQEARLSAELLLGKVPALAEREVYVCAPPGFIEAARGMLIAVGLPAEQFHTESFTPPTLVRPADPTGRSHRIRFVRSGREIEVSGTTTLLEAAREAGISVPTGCERGLCRACVCTKIAGETQHDMGAANPLARITVCNSLPRSNIELDL